MKYNKEAEILSFLQKIKDFRKQFVFIFKGFDYPIELFEKERVIWPDQCRCALLYLDAIVSYLHNLESYLEKLPLSYHISISQKHDLLFLVQRINFELNELKKKITLFLTNSNEDSFQNPTDNNISKRISNIKNEFDTVQILLTEVLHQTSFVSNRLIYDQKIKINKSSMQ